MKLFFRQKMMVSCLLLNIIILVGCAAPKVVSQWPVEVIQTNGSDDEWRGTPQYHDEKKHIVVRVMNDSEILYVCFSANDPELKRKLIMTGLTLWIDPEGGKNKKYGIRLLVKSPQPPPEFSKEDRDSSRKRKPPSLKMPERLELIHPDTSGPLIMNIEKSKSSGVEIGVGQPNGRLVYEYKIKMKGENVIFALDTVPYMGIGIESGKIDMGEMKRKGRSKGGPMSKSGGGGGSFERRGGMKGPGGRGSGHSDFKRMGEPLEVWLKVEIAQKTSLDF
ncbi:hypothetical protein QUF75_06845 [Desulfococcaceae bacterium HSG7]|nr:hypothetical protein [Desulfococcaceae bacterium HSG7]